MNKMIKTTSKHQLSVMANDKNGIHLDIFNNGTKGIAAVLLTPSQARSLAKQLINQSADIDEKKGNKK